MILSDIDIKREIRKNHLVISPYHPSSVQPASYDVKLGTEFRIFKNIHKPFLDIRNHIEDFMELIKIKKGSRIIIHPGEFILGTTVERVEIPNDLIARLDGKSSLGRLGIIVHATAGYVDPGFKGYITLELSNMANIPIALYQGMKIGQISFMRLESSAEIPYGRGRNSKYQGQKGPTASRVWKDFKKDRS